MPRRSPEPFEVDALRLRIRTAVPAREAVELERMLDGALQAAALARTKKKQAKGKGQG